MLTRTNDHGSTIDDSFSHKFPPSTVMNYPFLLVCSNHKMANHIAEFKR